MADTNAAPQPQHGKLYRTLGWIARHVTHHPHFHFGANTLSILMGIAIGLWMWSVFWMSSEAPGLSTISWVFLAYAIIELGTAALSIFSRIRWFAPLVDLLVSFAMSVEAADVLLNQSALGVTEMRLQIAWLYFFLALGTMMVGMLITLIVNTRTIGGGPIPTTSI